MNEYSPAKVQYCYLCHILRLLYKLCSAKLLNFPQSIARMTDFNMNSSQSRSVATGKPRCSSLIAFFNRCSGEQARSFAMSAFIYRIDKGLQVCITFSVSQMSRMKLASILPWRENEGWNPTETCWPWSPRHCWWQIRWANTEVPTRTYEIGSDCEKPARCREANGEARSG